jgi:hypothetical protein
MNIFKGIEVTLGIDYTFKLWRNKIKF